MKVVFETAALSAALNDAAKVAPTRGEAFDKASGIVLDLTADEAIVMATDTIVRFSTWLTPESYEGEPTSWRLPAGIFAGVIAKLKPSTSRTLTLEQEGKLLKLTHGRTRAQFQLVDIERYPRWTPFSPDDMTEVSGLSKAVSMVLWAAEKNGDPPLTAVHLNGEFALATNRYRFASAPCKLSLESPITIPPAAVTSILKPNASVMMRVDGKQVCLMPDDFTQVSLTAYGVEYPPVEMLMVREWPVMVRVAKQKMTDMLEQVLTMTGSDRDPTLVLIFGKQEIAGMVTNQEIGLIGNVVETPGQLDMPRVERRFNPDNFVNALNGSPGNEITIGFNPEKVSAPVYIDGGAEGVEFWIAPRQKLNQENANA